MASIAAAAKDRHTGIRNEEVSLKLGLLRQPTFARLPARAWQKGQYLPGQVGIAGERGRAPGAYRGGECWAILPAL
jgi:hypothetical protein